MTTASPSPGVDGDRRSGASHHVIDHKAVNNFFVSQRRIYDDVTNHIHRVGSTHAAKWDGLDL